MVIIGAVIGSGFSSGKEIAVFFAQFGSLSYIFIPLVFLMFCGAFYWIMSHGRKGVETIASSKAYLFLFVLISLVFTSSMFAGTKKTISTDIYFLDAFLIFALIFFCIIVSKKGLIVLTKTNLYLMPFTILVLGVCLVKNIGQPANFHNGNIISGGFFSVLYVIMNISTSSLVMGQLGEEMSKKRIFFVSLFSAFVLSFLLLLIDLTILSNPESLSLSMPLLEISSGSVYVLMRIVIFIGCLTTLLSLVYTTSQSLQKLGTYGVLNIFISIFIPFFVSFFGFGQIVSFLYPVVSVLGILLLTPFLGFNKGKKAGLTKLSSKKKCNMGK